MAQSRAVSEIPSAAVLNQQLKDLLADIKTSLSCAFEAAGVKGIFDHFWDTISPVDFPCDNLEAITKYYTGQVNRIDLILEINKMQELAFDKKLILKATAELCHSIARIKYIMDKLAKEFPKPDITSSSCQALKDILKLDIFPSNINQRDNLNSELTLLEKQTQFIAARLLALGYISNDGSIANQRIYRDSLPENLLVDLDKLKNNSELNELIEPVEEAKKAGRSIAHDSQPLIDEINFMSRVKSNLSDHYNAVTQSLNATLEQINLEKRELEQLLSDIDGNIYALKLYQIYSELENDRYCPSLKNTIKNINGFCEKNVSTFSASSIWRANDPWSNAKKSIESLFEFNDKLLLFLNTYRGKDINLHELQRKYLALTKRHQKLCELLSNLQEKIKAANQIARYFEQSIDDTIRILQDHLLQPVNNSVLTFAGRHWGKMTAGGTLGGLTAVTAVLISTNPLLLAACIVSGAVIGAAGGTGGGLLQDTITEKRKVKNRPSSSGSGTKSYGSIWQTNSAASAADASSTMALRK